MNSPSKRLWTSLLDKAVKAEVPDHSPKDAERAIDAAEAGFHLWRKSFPAERAEVLHKTAALLRQKKEPLAETMAHEMGKTVKDGVGEIAYAAAFFDWFAGETERIYGRTLHSQNSAKRLEYRPEPLGVAAFITPWNFPFAMPARKIAAALAAGCSCILKPPAECPLSGLAFAELLQEAGLPDKVFSVLLGDGSALGKVLLASPKVRKLSFTGSTEVGKLLFRESGSTLKKLTLELGGNAPALVFEDADIEQAADALITAKFRASGQTCVAVNRVLVHDSVASALAQALKKRIEKLSIGSPLKEETDLTTILHRSVTPKVEAHIKDALEKGADGLLIGKEPYEPTLLANVTPSMRIFNEETFGPVLPLIAFKDDKEALQLASATEAGLAAYLFTSSLKTAEKALEELQFGIIGLNDGLPSSAETAFGGIKNSGFGREGGPTGIEEYQYIKCVSVKL